MSGIADIPKRLRDPNKGGSDDRDDIEIGANEVTLFISEVYRDRDKPPTSRACPSERVESATLDSVQRSRSVARASRCKMHISWYSSQLE